jgi:hypothetical protein
MISPRLPPLLSNHTACSLRPVRRCGSNTAAAPGIRTDCERVQDLWRTVTPERVSGSTLRIHLSELPRYIPDRHLWGPRPRISPKVVKKIPAAGCSGLALLSAAVGPNIPA